MSKIAISSAAQPGVFAKLTVSIVLQRTQYFLTERQSRSSMQNGGPDARSMQKAINWYVF